jgi:hypothetical protein
MRDGAQDGGSLTPVMTHISLDGRRFRSERQVSGGDVGADTVFEYHQQGNLVHATYRGGAVRLGYLVGSQEGSVIDFRYVQLRADGTTASGHCRSTIEELPDGRLRLHERWEWESQPGSGTSVVEEIGAPGPGAGG